MRPLALAFVSRISRLCFRSHFSKSSDLSFYRFLENFKIYLRNGLIALDRFRIPNCEIIVTPVVILFRHAAMLYNRLDHAGAHGAHKEKNMPPLHCLFPSFLSSPSIHSSPPCSALSQWYLGCVRGAHLSAIILSLFYV